MPGNTIESLDVQFGSIGFLDNTEEDLLAAVEKTPAQKSDAATSTTPHSAVESSEVQVMPGIHQVSGEQ